MVAEGRELPCQPYEFHLGDARHICPRFRLSAGTRVILQGEGEFVLPSEVPIIMREWKGLETSG